MHNAIAEAGDLAPFDLWVALREVFGQLPGCLANDLQVPHHRIDSLLVRLKAGPVQSGGVTLDPGDGLANVREEKVSGAVRHKSNPAR